MGFPLATITSDVERFVLDIFNTFFKQQIPPNRTKFKGVNCAKANRSD